MHKFIHFDNSLISKPTPRAPVENYVGNTSFGRQLEVGDVQCIDKIARSLAQAPALSARTDCRAQGDLLIDSALVQVEERAESRPDVAIALLDAEVVERLRSRCKIRFALGRLTGSDQTGGGDVPYHGTTVIAGFKATVLLCSHGID